MDLFGPSLLKNAGGEKTSTAEAMEGSTAVLVYFSAHWCPPCRMFTPMLVETYNQLKRDGKKVEVVFVSSDRTETGFTEYFSSMPWSASFSLFLLCYMRLRSNMAPSPLPRSQAGRSLW